MKKELFIPKRKTSEKKSGVEKYLFIGFIIVLLGVILVDTRYSGYQTMDPMAGPGGYYHGQPPSAQMPSNDWAPYSYGSPQMPDMTPPYSTPMPPEMTYGSPQAPTGMPSGPSGNPDMSFYMGPKCNGGEVFTTFPYYPDKNSFIYTRPNGEEIKISEFEAYTKCTKMKQKLGRCSLGDEWREGQWGTGCYSTGVSSDHTQPTYGGWESADCCAPKEKMECPNIPDPTNPSEMVQLEACNPGAEDYLGLECCNTKWGYKCDDGKCVEKSKICDFGDGPEYVCGAKDPRASRTFGKCISYDGDLLEFDEKYDTILPTFLIENRFRKGPKSVSGCEDKEQDKEVCHCSSEFLAISCVRQGGLPTDFYLWGSQGGVLLSYTNGRIEYLEDKCFTNQFLERYGCDDNGEFAEIYSEHCNKEYYCLDEAVCRRGFSCIDSDGGKDFYVPGETYILEENTGVRYDLIKDICKSHTKVNFGIPQVVTRLIEGYCKNDRNPAETFTECDCIPSTSACIPPPSA